VGNQIKRASANLLMANAPVVINRREESNRFARQALVVAARVGESARPAKHSFRFRDKATGALCRLGMLLE
jgi:hypothetical protein